MADVRCTATALGVATCAASLAVFPPDPDATGGIPPIYELTVESQQRGFVTVITSVSRRTVVRVF